MPRLGWLSFLLAGAVLASGLRAEERPARVEVVADVGAAKAGEPFTVGFHFKLDPTWHIYWQNPGRAGIETRVKWTLPNGVTAGPLQFPVPIKFVQPGDIVGYGYEDEVLLTAVVTPSSDYAQGELPVVAEVSWLCCADTCIPGRQTLELKVPMASKARAANEELFATWARRLPVQSGGAADDYLAKVEATSSKLGPNEKTLQVVAEWKRQPRKVEFYPGGHKALEVPEPKLTQRQGGGKSPARTQVEATVRALPGQKQWPAVLEGLLVYETGGGERRGVVVAMPAPDRPAEGAAASGRAGGLFENPR